METLYPTTYFPNINLLLHEMGRKSEWTKEENKKFERALAIYADETPDKWLKVASMTGKSVHDVVQQYMKLEADVSDIEAGLVPFPGYLSPSYKFETVRDSSFDEFRKRPLATGSYEHERKKGVPWTEYEHRKFLMGLEKHGKGDWRNISRNFVISKTPTQVASHAQKYFNRQNSTGKEKKRPSIHDITTVHLTHIAPSTNYEGSSLNISTVLPHRSQRMSKMSANIKPPDSGEVMIFESNLGNWFNGVPVDPLFQFKPERQQIING